MVLILNNNKYNIVMSIKLLCLQSYLFRVVIFNDTLMFVNHSSMIIDKLESSVITLAPYHMGLDCFH